MPTLKQGDIFERLQEHEMAIVFGHIGLNNMASCWRNFSRAEGTLANIADPFTTMPNSPRRISSGQWLWFIPEGQNHGMTEEEVQGALDRALSWAQAKGHRRIVTNGVSDIDHGTDTLANRASDDRRGRFLIDYATRREAKSNGTLCIELVSLNDAFVRNANFARNCFPPDRTD